MGKNRPVVAGCPALDGLAPAAYTSID